MIAKIIECIPNFSEAKRTSVIEEIYQSIRQVPGISVLDKHSDMDHNRTVITFVGNPDAVEQAAYAAIETSARLIDLNMHRGAHPRIGATDVVPFVPISGVTMNDCVELSKALGKRVGEQLNIPVYLYEESAQRPDRKYLENIRRGQYEGLKEKIINDPSQMPDYGPALLGPAGATVIGARFPLIAYNVYLSTDNIEIAKNIALAIRHSSGGLHYLKAMGVIVNGKAQVSMNFTNYEKTPIARVFELIRSEASKFGVCVVSSELVGMIPQKALIDAAKWYLQLHHLKDEQILEYGICNKMM